MNNLSLAVNLIFVGIVVVFLALAALILVIFIATRLLSIKKASSQAAPASELASSLEIDEDEIETPATDAPDDHELVAVITAAINALYTTGADIKLRVKSFRRIPSNSPIWNMEGRKERLIR